MSKIQPESKSQPSPKSLIVTLACGSYVKDTTWKQITTSSLSNNLSLSCGSYVKDTTWKQITTFQKYCLNFIFLWILCQRYNLKANHNVMRKASASNCPVDPMSKIQPESKSQRRNKEWVLLLSCGSYVKDTTWKQITTDVNAPVTSFPLWILCQRYNLKANHNGVGTTVE